MTRTGKIILIVLAVLNIVLLVQNYFLKKNENSFSDKYEVLKSEIYEFGGKGKLLNPLSYLYSDIELLPASAEVNNNDVFMLVVFDDHGCPACIEHHVNLLNKMPNELHPYVSVLYNGEQKDYLDSFRPSFKYVIKKPEEQLFSKSMNFPRPMAFLIAGKKIYMLHRTEAASNLKTELFYQRATNLLSKIYKNNN